MNLGHEEPTTQECVDTAQQAEKENTFVNVIFSYHVTMEWQPDVSVHALETCNENGAGILLSFAEDEDTDDYNLIAEFTGDEEETIVWGSFKHLGVAIYVTDHLIAHLKEKYPKIQITFEKDAFPMPSKPLASLVACHVY